MHETSLLVIVLAFPDQALFFLSSLHLQNHSFELKGFKFKLFPSHWAVSLVSEL